MKSVLIFCNSLMVVVLFITCSSDHENKLPNIIYILADDLGVGDVSCYNAQSKIITPNIDALADNGILFQDAHSGSAVCTPTRYGVLTGRYAWRTRVKQGVLWSWDEALIDSNMLTVADILHQSDYHTACVGKWHLGLGWQKGNSTYDVRLPLKESPLNNGFDYFFGITASLDIPPYVYIENNQSTSQQIDTIEANSGKGFWRKGPIGHDFEMEDVLPRFTRKAIQYIDSKKSSDQPFFLYFPLPAPHTPILPTEPFRGKSNTNEYGDFVLMVDDLVGQIMETLKANGQYDNTLVIFTSDNGCSPMADFDELARVDHHPSYVYRGHKADIFEGGHRVPFIVHWPEKVKSRQRVSGLVCLTDLLATCADLTGYTLDEASGVDSYSFLPVMNDQSLERPSIVHHSINGSFALRRDQWKLIFAPGSGGWSAPLPAIAYTDGLPQLQLYDVQSDPGENNNLVEEHPDVVKALTEEMNRIISKGRSTPGIDQPNDTPVDLYFAKHKFVDTQ